MLTRVPDIAERAVALDGPAATAAGAIGRLLAHSRIEGVLRGDWLGHVVHPALTDMPIGFWTTAFVLDLVPIRRLRPVADSMVALGLVAAVPAAATGAADFSGTTGTPRRVAFIHGAANLFAVIAYASSLLARVRGRRRRALVHGFVGAVAATVAGTLGGHLVYRLGTGVVPGADDTIPGATSAASAVPRPTGSSPR